MTDKMAAKTMKPIEAAAEAILNAEIDDNHSVFENAARAAVLAYLKALAVQGPSKQMEKAKAYADQFGFPVWSEMLETHIEELEASK